MSLDCLTAVDVKRAKVGCIHSSKKLITLCAYTERNATNLLTERVLVSLGRSRIWQKNSLIT